MKFELKTWIQSFDKIFRNILMYFTGGNKYPNIFSYKFLTYYSLKRNLKTYAKYANGLLLDIGCEEKPYYDIFKPYVKNYIGIDHHRVKQHLGERIFADLYNDAPKLSIKSSSIDTIVFTHIWYYMEEQEQLLQELKRVLKPGGLLIGNMLQNDHVVDLKYDQHRLTQKGIRYILEKSHLKIITIQHDGQFWIFFGQMLIHYLDHVGFKNYRSFFLKIIVSIFKVIFSPLFLIFIATVNTVCIIFDKFENQNSFSISNSFVAQKKY